MKKSKIILNTDACWDLISLPLFYYSPFEHPTTPQTSLHCPWSCPVTAQWLLTFGAIVWCANPLVSHNSYSYISTVSHSNKGRLLLYKNCIVHLISRWFWLISWFLEYLCVQFLERVLHTRVQHWLYSLKQSNSKI